MSEIIGDLGYTLEAYSGLMGLIKEISGTGNLEDFVKFKIELSLAIDNRDSLSREEREAVSECMKKDNYFEDLRTGEYLDEICEFVDYADETIKAEGYTENYCDEEFLKNIFLEGLYELENYIKEGVEQAKFEADEKENVIREYDFISSNFPFKRI